jgi:precorrin-6B C5,15-methyltransferase / cobalt-precorrin-6B C5,C15-methyltransferase
MAAVTVIGVGADGCASLSSRAVNAVARAQVLVGGERQLAFFPQFSGERLVVRSQLRELMATVAERAGEANVAVLASGDPMFFGIGALVVRTVGAEHVEVIPQPSAMQWAFARVGMSWNDAELISVHGRSLAGLVTRLRSVHKVACFTDADRSPAQIAARMLEHGEDRWRAWVCEQLGGAGERVREFALADLAGCGDIDPLNVLILCRTDPSWRPPPVVPNTADEEFDKRMPKRGLITKREVRALALAALELRVDSVVWDVGAGSGAVAIDAATVAHRGRVYAVEIDPEGVEICRRNARAHGVDNVEVVAGRAPEALAGLPAADAVFIGGSKGSLDAIVGEVVRRSAPGARAVVTAVTLENVYEAYRAFTGRTMTPQVTLVNISRAVPLARYQRYEALNPIHIISATLPGAAGAELARP